MLVRILRLLLGYVEFTASGGFFERFINLCNFEGVRLWNIVRENDTLTACASIGDYKHIRKPARRSGMRVKLRYKRGLPFVLHGHRARAGLLIGFVILIAFVSIMSSALWEIEVTGAESAESERILEILKDDGIKIGAFKAKINADKAERDILSKMPELSWVTVNILGSKAQVEIRMAVISPDIIDLNTPVNVVALKDGVIKLTEVYIGQKAVNENVAVVKGDLLISGVTVNKDGTEALCHADGKVFAETKTELSAKTSFQCAGQVITGVKNVYYLNFFSLKIPLCLKGENVYTTDIFLAGKRAVLPVGITRAVRTDLGDPASRLTENEAKLLSLLSLVRAERNDLSGLERESISRAFTRTEDGVLLTGSYKGIENIAVQKEIFVDKQS